MNDKTKTLIVAVIAIILVATIVDSRDSIQQTLSLIAFIMIFHFYLQRHMTDIYEISQDFSKKFGQIFGVGVKDTNSQYKDIQIQNKQTNYQIQETIKQIPDINEIHQKEIISKRSQIPAEQRVYLYEDQRLQQSKQRFIPNKSVRSQNKLAGNLTFWKNEWEDELTREEDRIWYEDNDINCY